MASKVQVLPKKVASFTPEDVDRFGVMLAEIKEKEGQADKIKERLREFVGAGNHLDGIAFRVEISEEPVKYDKVDYRALCLKYMKLANVENPAKVLKKLERETEAEVIDYGTPRVTVVPNPKYEP